MNNIGSTIAVLRKKNSMTQEELAVKIGVSAQSVSKWENGTNMPDITLLPVIAETFDISIDFLFGRETVKTLSPIKRTEIAEKAYEDVLLTIARAFIDCETSEEKLLSGVIETKEYLKKHPSLQTAVTRAGTSCGVYANKDVAVIWPNIDKDSIKLFDNQDCIDFIKCLADDDFRAVMKYQLENIGSMSYTATSAAKHCNITVEQATKALELLYKYLFVSKSSVDLGVETVDVYQLRSIYKMLLVYVIMSLSERLAKYEESYRGFSC